MTTAHGQLFIVAAPSGAGKTSLVQSLVSRLDHLKISISHTTRAKRPLEKNGVNYFFIDTDQFQQMIEQDAFLEYANVFNCQYGTSKAWVFDQLRQGTDIILEIDWQGANQIKQQFPQAQSIFILPPSLAELVQRLKKRQQDDSATIEYRMKQAQDEMEHYVEFDY
ncbi:MAG: guanylate kinase, partial [Legionellales bacterium]|nr:guanylate kinase [Legionellales bacterium]